MSIFVTSNLPAVTTQLNLAKSQTGLERTLGRLSSGLRINASGDDAAGLAVANRHRMDNIGLTVGTRNANDAISKLQIEDSALNNISSLLDRALTLATQAASDTFTGSRTVLDDEFSTVLSEITRTAKAAGLRTSNANLNARSVFVGNTQTSTSTVVSYVSFELEDAVDAEGIGLSTQTVNTQANAATAISQVQAAVQSAGAVQGRIGAAMNRLSFAITQAQTMSVSVRASESRIRDANIAEESASLMKFNILTQSGMSALSQANQAASNVVQLLR
jgi:flagellin